MKKRAAYLLLLFFVLAASRAYAASYYKVYVTRVDDNLYRDSGGLYIQTQFCFHYCYGEEAVLKYDPYAFDNKLIFTTDNMPYQVVKVFK